MSSAWIITREGTEHPMEVVGILSARKSIKEIQKFVEWLYALLYYRPEEHLAAAKYHGPTLLYPATPERAVPRMNCGDDPFLMARRATQVIFDKNTRVLTWDEPDRPEFDEGGEFVVKRLPGRFVQAPICLPDCIPDTQCR